MKLRYPSVGGHWFRSWLSGGYRRGDLRSFDTQCGRSVVQVLVVRMDIRVVAYETMTPPGGRSVVQFLFFKVDIGVLIYEALTPSVGCQWFRSWLSEWI